MTPNKLIFLVGVVLVIGTLLGLALNHWLRKKPAKGALLRYLVLAGLILILASFIGAGIKRNHGWKGMGPTLSSGFSVTAGELGKGWVAFRHFWNPATADSTTPRAVPASGDTIKVGTTHHTFCSTKDVEIEGVKGVVLYTVDGRPGAKPIQVGDTRHLSVMATGQIEIQLWSAESRSAKVRIREAS